MTNLGPIVGIIKLPFSMGPSSFFGLMERQSIPSTKLFKYGGISRKYNKEAHHSKMVIPFNNQPYVFSSSPIYKQPPALTTTIRFQFSKTFS